MRQRGLTGLGWGVRPVPPRVGLLQPRGRSEGRVCSTGRMGRARPDPHHPVGPRVRAAGPGVSRARRHSEGAVSGTPSSSFLGGILGITALRTARARPDLQSSIALGRPRCWRGVRGTEIGAPKDAAGVRGRDWGPGDASRVRS